jgi:hypothetical protein
MDTEEAKKAKYHLTDIQTQTVGLVPRGINKQKFLILKQKEDKEESMSEQDVTIEEAEVTETPATEETSPDGRAGPPADSFWDKARQYLEAKLTKGDEETDTEPEEPTPEPVTETQPSVDKTAETILKAQLDAIQEQHKTNLDAIQKAVEEKYEAKMEALQKQVDSAQAYADEQTEKAERREYLEKAMGMRTLPLATSDLGNLMYNVAKSVPAEEYEKVEALLKAADAQLGAAGIFGEMGTSRTPEQVELEDKVEKAATEKSYKEALLGESWLSIKMALTSP